MKDAQDFDRAAANAIRQDIGESADNQFPRSGDAARSAEIWLVGKRCGGGTEVQNKFGGRPGAFLREVGGFFVEIPQRRAQPFNPHIS